MEASIDAVRVAGTPDGPAPVVTLAVSGEDDVLPIFIGFDEARAIAWGQDAIDLGRPQTHDLLLDTMEELGGRVERITISAIDEDDTYLADLHLVTPRDTRTIDARPSDLLALAARTNVPIEVAPEVFAAGREPRATYDGFDDIREVMAS